MDEISIFNKALTQAEVTSLYAANPQNAGEAVGLGSTWKQGEEDIADVDEEDFSLVDIGQSYEEAKVMERLMFEAIAEETNLTTERLQEIVSKNVDMFFSAEQAVEMGIADIIV